MKSVVVLLLLTSSAHASDSREMLRRVYASLWTQTILNMFADAGPTSVKLVKKTLTIRNPNCEDAGVKKALKETFTPVRKKMKELDMKLRCMAG